MNLQPDEPTISDMAYRQTGHVLMAYRSLMAGVADRYFLLPIRAGDRDDLVPAFDMVSLEVDLSQADRPSPSLRSLITTPLFLMGGEAAERVHQSVSTESPLSHSTALV